MEAHAHDLRAEVDDGPLVEAMKTDWRRAALPAADRTLLEFAVRLTRSPGAMTRDDIDRLRAAGLNDRAISDAVQVVAYFNYINRVAGGLGVDLEAWMLPHPHGDRVSRTEEA